MIVLGKGTAKPTERSFKGKGVGDFRGIVRFWKVMWSDGRCGNPSGSRPNFFGRQHLTFDKGGKCGGAKQGIVRVWEVMRWRRGGDNNIKKRSLLVAVTAYLLYCFV